jgi:hypothetical protein
MSWYKTANAVGKKVADIATSKATQAAAGAVVERFGPHRALGKVGTALIVVGTLVLGLSWFFLTSWWFWVATAGGVGLIGVGFALRGVNNLLVNLLVRCINAVGKRFYAFASRRLPRVYAWLNKRFRRGQPLPDGGNNQAPGDKPQDATLPGDKPLADKPRGDKLPDEKLPGAAKTSPADAADE